MNTQSRNNHHHPVNFFVVSLYSIVDGAITRLSFSSGDTYIDFGLFFIRGEFNFFPLLELNFLPLV